MRCRYRETRFYNERSGYCVCVFLTEDHSVPQSARRKHRAEETIAFTAVGMNLPQSDHLEVELSGKWEKTKYGLQFLVESYTELLPQTEDGIYHYLASGLIKGVGPRTAERIVERFGERTFEVIEQYPESLLEIRGISRNKLDMILKSYGGNHVIRELAAELAPFSISPKKIQKVYEEFGEGFVFLPCRSPEEAAKKIEEEYESAVSLFGLSQVQVLSPYRKRSEAGVNALNEVLRELMNPADADKAERKTVGLIFREGDKVIQNKNMDPISNGDIGYITEIAQDEDVGTIFRIAFSGGRCVEYSEEDMEIMEHAYATTIHKAQGDEFEVVILPWLSSFFPMLQRNILYTAVTRAKRKVILAGELSAIARAIHNTRNTARNTMLGKRINQEYQELPGKQETISFPDGKTERYEQMVMNF